MWNIARVVLLLSACCLFDSAYAQDGIIGFVKVVNGETGLISTTGNIPLKPGVAISVGDTLITGDNSSVGVTLNDNTVLSLGPDTALRIDEFTYAPAQGKLKLLVNILKGTLHYISGVIAKLKPEAVSVKTPAGVIGVRGTRFLVKTEAE